MWSKKQLPNVGAALLKHQQWQNRKLPSDA